MRRSADVVVVGAGIVGLAAAHALVRRGLDVLCVERGRPGAGQSAGETRIFRHLHEDDALVRLACAARGAWRGWEDELGLALTGPDGVLVGCDDPRGLAARLTGLGARAEVIGPDEQRARHGVFAGLPGDAVLDLDGTALHARATVSALVARLQARVVHADVLGVTAGAVVTSEGIVGCERVVLCAGVETPALAAACGIEIDVDVACHVRGAFAVREPGVPLLAMMERTAAFGTPLYGIPFPGGALYGAGFSGSSLDDPLPPGATSLPPGIDPGERLRGIEALVARALPGVEPRAARTRVCLVTTLRGQGPDDFGLFGEGPAWAFAGHNVYKFAPLLGEAIADVVSGGERPDWLAP